MPATELSEVQITSDIMANYNFPPGKKNWSLFAYPLPSPIFYLFLFISQFQQIHFGLFEIFLKT